MTTTAIIGLVALVVGSIVLAVVMITLLMVGVPRLVYHAIKEPLETRIAENGSISIRVWRMLRRLSPGPTG